MPNASRTLIRLAALVGLIFVWLHCTASSYSFSGNNDIRECNCDESSWRWYLCWLAVLLYFPFLWWRNHLWDTLHKDIFIRNVHKLEASLEYLVLQLRKNELGFDRERISCWHWRLIYATWYLSIWFPDLDERTTSQNLDHIALMRNTIKISFCLSILLKCAESA